MKKPADIDPETLAKMEALEAKDLARHGIVYERNGFYARKGRKGFELYRPENTHAVQVGFIGFTIADALPRARVWVDRAAAI